MANTISIPWAESTLDAMGDTPFDRLWRGFMTARVTIAMVLLALLATLYMLVGEALGISDWLIALAGSYLVATLAVRMFARPKPPGSAFDPQWVFTIGVDLVAFSTLQLLQAGNINYGPLFALPVLMAAVLGSSLLALGTAAGVTLLLLAEAWVMVLQTPQELATRFLQAGLTGTGYFAVAVLVNQLAARLAREETAARNSRQMARVQAQVNELVIESMGDGVLVVDADARVRAANPAARKQLGTLGMTTDQPFTLTAHGPWEPLAELARLTFTTELSQRSEVAIDDGVGSPRRIQVRTRLTATQDNLTHSLCVMFLQDLREMEARLRTEKLAAMGRMSAAVAHEIRNPLAAIAQANALLEEDLVDPAQRQLSALVRQNAQRLDKIVEEILDISRVQHQVLDSPRLRLDESVTAACADWARQSGVGARLELSLADGGVQVQFEADHLRRVLINLLDNAHRYASSEPGSIRVLTQCVGRESTLRVWSDGPPLEATVRQHLFEPFFSSESRSSGLGLYICRELCERHGAQIGYRRGIGPGSAPRQGNEFFVVFRPHGPARAGNSSFDTIAA